MSVRFGLRLAVSCLALFSLSKAGFPQAVSPGPAKVGVVSLQQAVLGCAEIKKASAEMETKYRPRQQAMEKLQKEIEGVRQQLEANAGKLTASAQADLNAQGQRKQRDLQPSDDLYGRCRTAERTKFYAASRKMAEAAQTG